MSDTLTRARRLALASKGQAQPGGRYPIPDVAHLEKAIRAVGRSNTPGATRAYIIRRAKALGRTDLIPPDWQ